MVLAVAEAFSPLTSNRTLSSAAFTTIACTSPKSGSLICLFTKHCATEALGLAELLACAHVAEDDGADCTISASEETLMKIASGEANPTTAYMTGKLKIKGDMGAAMKLQKIF